MDSTKVEIVSKSFDKLVAKLTEQASNKPTIWDTLTPLLIGAGLTLLTQFLIEFWKSRKETNNKKQELISKGRAKTYLIAQILKDLAMYKVHKQYYRRAHGISISQADKDDNLAKHYQKGTEQRATESKLDENISEYFQLVTEYIVLTRHKDHFQRQFHSIFYYEHPRPSKFDNCNTEEELVTGLRDEEKKINQEYNMFRDIFESIQVSIEQK
ncbi:MAG: hypothetical protein JNK08_09275 [Sediminibacterium sp.]|nr:hypothetical protein [Sediminibacterium sp.]